jgi:hypothetical protein
MGEELPESFRFTIDNTTAMGLCFTSSPDPTTVSEARSAEPVIDAQVGGLLTCEAATEVEGVWSIRCASGGGDVVDVRLEKSLLTGAVALDRGGTACDVTLPMLTVEVLAP